MFAALLAEMREMRETYANELEEKRRDQAVVEMQQAFIKCQELWDEKIQVSTIILDMIEARESILTGNRRDLGLHVAPESNGKLSRPFYFYSDFCLVSAYTRG